MADKTSTLKEIQKYVSKGQLDKAISEMEKLVSSSPDGNMLNTLGDLYLKKAIKQKAAESYHKAANFFRHEGFSLKAMALYKKVLNINPSEPDALYSIGELNEEKGLITDAIRYYLATAESFVKSGQKEKILDVYEKVLSLSPTNVPLRNKVAEIFLKEGLSSDASREYVFVARIHDENNEIENAQEYYNKALELVPLCKEAVLGLSRLYEKSGEKDKAVDQMKEAAALFPEDTEVLVRCAELSLSHDDRETAKNALSKVTEIDPDHIGAKRMLAEILLKEGEKDKAWDEYHVVIDEMISNENYGEAISLLESFREIDAVETGKRLIAIYKQQNDSDHLSDELVRLADKLSENSETHEALIFYKEALEIKPDDPFIRQKIVDIEGIPVEKVSEESRAEKQPVKEHISVKAEKSADEIFTEVDIFARYGLLNEAQKLLEGLKSREPENIDVRTRLITVYKELQEKELAVSECLIAHDLLQGLGNKGAAEKMIEEATSIDPDDPRLKATVQAFQETLSIEPTSFAVPESSEPVGAVLEEQTIDAAPEGSEPAGAVFEEQTTEDLHERISEADVYAQQGLTQEAKEILETLQGIYPDNSEVEERLRRLAEMASEDEPVTAPEHDRVEQDVYEIEEETPVEPAVDTSEVTQDVSPQEPGAADNQGYEDFSISEEDIIEAEDVPEPVFDSDVMEVFDEFKKGLEKELGDEDSETHYNLGIAYKEMGLLDDAIKEFQTSRKDPARNTQSLTMLGLCYIDKGLFTLAIDSLEKARAAIDAKDESYWAIQYDLASAHERNGDFEEALKLYTEVYGWNAKFRNVSDKVNAVKAELSSGDTQKKKKERRDRVSYL